MSKNKEMPNRPPHNAFYAASVYYLIPLFYLQKVGAYRTLQPQKTWDIVPQNATICRNYLDMLVNENNKQAAFAPISCSLG